MSVDGTAEHLRAHDLPPRVARAVASARDAGFENSCRPAHGRLLSVLAGGIGAGRIGETGTGCGVGLAWLASTASPAAVLTSIEADPDRAALARELFADDPRTTVLAGDWRALLPHGPFDLLVLDGCGHGKRGDEAIDPAAWLRPGGLLVIDDFVPADTWPPTYADGTDEARLLWLTHPLLLATEIRTDPDAATIVARRRPG
jgi:predicted O-methyltransferase YrrM